LFFDRPEFGTQAFLVHIQQDDSTPQELNELVLSAGLVPVGYLVARKRNPDPKTYIGSGKLAEIKAQAQEDEAGLIIFDQDLTPTQERNLEAFLECRILGRTGLILEIFAQRARTHEGKLQVELAQLQHASTRLVRGWTHLDRQRGGSGRGQGAAIGVTGAGETQLEADQRMISDRIKHVSQRLQRVQKQRAQNRRSRQRADVKTVSLAGYTNAGKSTLFNRLCESDVHAADQLFATLDPTLRELRLPIIGKAILTDTVGFIRQLPHGLVDAFRATLEEVKQSDLIVHVVDGSSEERDLQMTEVDLVLEEIKASDVPQLLIYNKIDLIEEGPRVDRDADGQPTRVWVSSLTGEGIPELIEALSQRLSHDVVEPWLKLNPAEGQLRSALFDLDAVLEEEVKDDGMIYMHVRIEEHRLNRLLSRFSSRQ
jgi:GTP-binding protein HflX